MAAKREKRKEKRRKKKEEQRRKLEEIEAKNKENFELQAAQEKEKLKAEGDLKYSLYFFKHSLDFIPGISCQNWNVNFLRTC